MCLLDLLIDLDGQLGDLKHEFELGTDLAQLTTLPFRVRKRVDLANQVDLLRAAAILNQAVRQLLAEHLRVARSHIHREQHFNGLAQAPLPVDG